MCIGSPQPPTPSYLYVATVNRWQQSIFMDCRCGLVATMSTNPRVEKSFHGASRLKKYQNIWKVYKVYSKNLSQKRRIPIFDRKNSLNTRFETTSFDTLAP